MEKANKKKGGWKRALLTTLCVVLAVILVAAVGVTIFAERMFSRLNPLDTNTLSQEEIDAILKETDAIDPNYTGLVIDPDDLTNGEAAAPVISGEHIIQILLIGQDRREHQSRQRSDAMILCTINKQDKTMTLTSFMRDMYVQIPGYGGNKINACYQFGGMPLLDACLENSFGIQVDGNVEVDFQGFMEIIDILGGVDMELSEAEANYLNIRGNWEVEDNQHWDLKAGMNHLTGSQALAYSRIRAVNDTVGAVQGGHNYADYGRTSRQRRMLTAVFDKVKSMNLSDIDKVLPLVNKVLDHVATDMDRSQIISYIAEVLPILGQLEIKNLRIPADGTFHSALVGNLDALVPDLEANRQILIDNLT